MDVGALINGIGSSVAGTANLVGTLVTNNQNKHIAQDNRNWQSEENERQRQWELEQWEREMQYNSPAAVMERYRAAGINPFLGQSKIGEGTTSAPSAPAPQGAPNQPSMVAPNFDFVGDGISKALGYLLNKQATEANAANQNALSLSNVADAAQKFYDLFGEEKAIELITPMLGEIRGAQMDGNVYARQALAGVKLQEAKASLESLNFDIEKQFGKERAQQIVWNLQNEAAEVQTRMGLYNSLAKLNDSNIEVNKARIKELLSSSFNQYYQGVLAKEKGITESQARKYFIQTLKVGLAEQSMDMLEQFADFVGNEDVREFKQSKANKTTQLLNYTTSKQGNPFIGAGSNVMGILKEMWPEARVQGFDPTRFVKYRRKGMTPQGRPEFTEWYQPNPNY